MPENCEHQNIERAVRLFALALIFVWLAAHVEFAQAAEEKRAINFPAHCSFGWIDVITRGVLTRYGIAQGTVLVPRSAWVQVSAPFILPSCFWEIEKLPPGDIQSLNFDQTNITDDAADHLVKINRLRRLSLRHTAITDKTLIKLTALPDLEELSCVRTSITGNCSQAGPRVFAHLKTLETGACPLLSDDILLSFQFPQLEHLNLNGCSITGKNLAWLKRCPNLSSIVLSMTKVDDQALAQIPDLRKLKVLDLSFCHAITDSGLRHLGPAKHIDNLDLSFTRVVGSGLVRFSNVSDLNLYGCPLTIQCLESLRAMHRLKKLKVCYPQLEGTVVSQLLEAVPAGLLNLDVCGAQVTSKSLSGIVRLTSLETLRLEDTIIDDQIVETLVRLKSLKSVDLKRTKVSNVALSKLAALCPHLKVDSASR